MNIKNIFVLTVTLGVLFFGHVVAFANTYFVDGVNGLDTNDGLTEQTSWKTIGRALNSPPNWNVKSGDTVLIKGGIYRERISIQRSGTVDKPITVKSFGDGEVVLDASPIPVGTWELSSGSIYRMKPGFVVSNVVVAEKPLLPAVVQWKATSPYIDDSVYNVANMSKGYFFYEYNTGWLYVWLKGGGNPNSADLHMIKYASAGNDGIYMWNASYWIFENITIQYAAWYGVNWQGDTGTGNNIYRNLTVKFSGNTGIGGGPSATIEKNTVYYNVMRNWPRGRWNGGAGGWGSGIQATRDAQLLSNTVHDNGGEGVLSYKSNNVVYRGNTIYDNWSVNLYIDNEQNILVENNFIYCNEPDYIVTTNSGCEGLNCLKRVRGIGIMTADEYYDGVARLQNVTIRNNFVINCRRGYWHSADVGNSGMKNVDIINNTFVTPATKVDYTVDDGSGDNYFALGIIDKYDVASGSEIANNIMIARNPHNYALWAETSGDMFGKYNFHNNLFFNTASSTPIHWGPDYATAYDYTLAGWGGLPGLTHGNGAISRNPLFANIGGLNILDYSLSDSSPARGASGSTSSPTDFHGTPWANPASIGAVEFGSVSGIPSIIGIQIGL